MHQRGVSKDDIESTINANWEEKYFEEKEVTAKAFPNELNIVSPNPSVNRTVSRR